MGAGASMQMGAVSGTVSGYMSVCHTLHVPRDSDIIFVECEWVAFIWLMFWACNALEELAC